MLSGSERGEQESEQGMGWEEMAWRERGEKES